MLQTVPKPSPGGPHGCGTTRGNARTDDRGMYELPNLAPGDYRLSVHAQPWYVAGGQSIRAVGQQDASPLDPSLDFAYPVTWFPGVSDAARAETITLACGRYAAGGLSSGSDSVDSFEDTDSAATGERMGNRISRLGRCFRLCSRSVRAGAGRVCSDDDADRRPGPDRCRRVDAGGLPDSDWRGQVRRAGLRCRGGER